MIQANRLALLVLCAIVAPGRLLAQDPALIFRDLEALPADIDSVVVVENARLFRNSEIGRSAAEVMESYVTLARTREAWQEFSMLLGMSEAETFDAIFGAHFALVTRDANFAGRPSGWTLVSDVDARTGRILRKELRAAPRTIIKGVPVLAIEDGRFEMAVLSRHGRDRVLLAPRKSVEFQREVATALANGVDDSFARTPQAERLTEMGEGNAYFWRRGVTEEETWLAGVFIVRPESIRARLVAKTPKHNAELPAHSLDIFAAVMDDALFATVETLETGQKDDLMGSWLFGDLQQRVDQTFRVIGAERAAALILEQPDGGLSFAVSAAVEASEETPVLVDEAMNKLLVNLSMATGGGLWDFDFGGLRPEAERVADLSEQAGRKFPLLGDERLEIRWGGHAEHWWTASTPGESGSVLREAINNEQQAVKRRWLSVGVVRPSALLAALDRVVPEVPEAFDGIRRIESMVWTSWRQKSDEVWARIEIKTQR